MKRLGKVGRYGVVRDGNAASPLDEPGTPAFDAGECQEANLMCFWSSFEDVFLVFVLFKVEVVRSAGWFSF